jgi:metallo-beta-lactamase class B
MMTLPLLSLVTLLGSGFVADPPHQCDACEEWNRPQDPFRVHGNTWYVGPAGVSAVLVTSADGHILLDGGLPQSAPLIVENIRKAGFRLEDVKLIVNTHAHYDHAGGIASLQRASGARVAASPAGKRALENGGPLEDDPQFAFGPKHNNFPRVSGVQEIRDRDTLRVGDLAITVHFTPGHTPGGTSWSWRSCDGDNCLDLVYADSLNAVSAPGFRFDEPAMRAAFESTIARVETLPCDILLAAHPVAIAMDVKLEAWRRNPAVNPFVGSNACRSYAAGARTRLQARLEEERAAKPAP